MADYSFKTRTFNGLKSEFIQTAVPMTTLH